VTVPSTYLGSVSPPTNGAITDLGFRQTDSNTTSQKSSAGHAFLENTVLSADLTLQAPVSATASLGFIGVTATGNASLEADATFSLVDPTSTNANSKVLLSNLITALGAGKFLYKDDGSGGPIQGMISGAGAADFLIQPTGSLGSLVNVSATGAI